MKKLICLSIPVALLLFIAYLTPVEKQESGATVLQNLMVKAAAITGSGGAAPTCLPGSGDLDNSGASDNDYWAIADGDEYQEVHNAVGEITICQVDVEMLYSTSGTATFQITINTGSDGSFTPVANGASNTEDTALTNPGGTLSFDFPVNPVVTGDFAFMINVTASTGRARVETSECPAGYELYYNTASATNQCLGFKVYYLQ